MKLSLETPARYRVKHGQTLQLIAETFQISCCVLIAENALTEEVCEGQVLSLPQSGGNAYTVRGGESKTLLCGSPENFQRANGTQAFYPGQKIFLS